MTEKYAGWYQGMSVVPIEGHQDYEEYKHQWADSAYGMIITDMSQLSGVPNDELDDYWIEVRWENGEEYCYRLGMLKPYEPHEEHDATHQLFDDYQKFINNPCAEIPLPEESISPRYITVDVLKHIMPTYTNTLATPDKEDDGTPWQFARLDADPAKHKKKEETKMNPYDMPFLAGTKVCLNPDDRNYDYYRKEVGSTTGYVVNNMLGDSNLISWRKLNVESKKNYSHTIRFDNGTVINLQVKQLLPVDAPSKTVYNYTFIDGSMYVFIEDDPKFKETMDNMIIKNRKPIHHIETWDNEWRAKITEKILNSK